MVEMNIELARHNMIEQQIRPWEVLDQRVLDTIESTPRERFMPVAYRNVAFSDVEVPIGHGETTLPPRVEGRMLQALDIRPDDRVLEIGTGCGYTTALLAKLGRQVFSIEIHEALSAQAATRLEAEGFTNITLETGNAAEGWHDHAPYDVIAVTGGLPYLPDTLRDNLAVGGRLFAIVGTAPTMEALLVTRLGDNEWQSESLFETVIPPLTGIAGESLFTL